MTLDLTLQSASRPTRPGPPRFLRVAEYHARVHRRLWRGNLLVMLLGPGLYLLAMGLGVGSLIDDRPSSAIGGVPYLAYVAPGLLASAAMQTAVGHSLYPVLASVKWLRTAYGLAATPLRPVDIALGLQAWLAVLLLLGATVFLGLAALAGAVHSPLALLAPPTAALGGLAYSAGGSAWAASRDSEQSFQPIIRLAILPSFLLSGTFFPISQLPAPLEALAAVTPLWHSVSLARGFTSGDIGVGAALGHLAVLVAFTAVGLVAAGRAYQKRLHR
jgi:lipooligosaccharide transport system permease protein